MTAEERTAAIDMIAQDPTCGVSLAGALRKVRFAVSGRGKSGGVRIIYYFHSDRLPTFLLTVFAKNEKDNLSKAELADLVELSEILAETYGVSAS